MPRYVVTCWPRSPVSVEVEAESEDAAIVEADFTVASFTDSATWECREAESGHE